MTTKTRRAQTPSPAGEPAGDEPEVVTPPSDESPGEPPAGDDDETNPEPEAKPKPEPVAAPAPSAEPGFFASLKNFWWDKEV